MAQMTERMKKLFDKVPTVVLSTVSEDGTPNAVPVGAKKIIGDEMILISDQFFSKTLANMKANPRVAVTFWEEHEGYQLKGSITIETSGRRFEDTSRWIEKRSSEVGFPFKSKGAVILRIEEIYGVSPGLGAGKKLA